MSVFTAVIDEEGDDLRVSALGTWCGGAPWALCGYMPPPSLKDNTIRFFETHRQGLVPEDYILAYLGTRMLGVPIIIVRPGACVDCGFILGPEPHRCAQCGAPLCEAHGDLCVECRSE